MSRRSIKPIEGFENLLFISRYGRPLCDQTIIDAIDRIVAEINGCRDEAVIALNDYYFDIEQQNEVFIEDNFKNAVIDSRKIVSFV
ncbi:hypothetical protein SAMN02910298_00246 [Pseudobutyrivibrio sp. YE44]|uniref:hypothetical protein n=1 Tax=Pseudobutyrivibrio sp. YE44 TaxID=1520802 RepID=UPI00088D9E3C|nr:hypothetical protein [Pseudobutyrivibrio sp. YE44]SDB07455.1 hypothetical protein SAMN02910298_00246 [Pseudobutyrivibrio sp. YE44]